MQICAYAGVLPYDRRSGLWRAQLEQSQARVLLLRNLPLPRAQVDQEHLTASLLRLPALRDAV